MHLHTIQYIEIFKIKSKHYLWFNNFPEYNFTLKIKITETKRILFEKQILLNTTAL